MFLVRDKPSRVKPKCRHDQTNVLLLCIQLNQFLLGVAMVAAFSVGLAITLVAIGIAASWAPKGRADLNDVRKIRHRIPLTEISVSAEHQ